MASHPLLTLILVAGIIACTPVGAAEGTPGHRPRGYIGYWHDGSGVIPDCTVVDNWNEMEFTKSPDKGPDQPAGEKRVNIVYKVPHYNWCNGGLIMVGGRLYTLNDRGGIGFYADKAAEFAGVELFCIDPETGKELWRRDLDHWDLVPGGAELRKKVLAYNQLEAKTYGAYAPMGSAMRNRNKVPLTPERYLELAEPLRDLISDLPKTLADLKGHTIDSQGYEQIHFFGTVAKKYFPEMLELRKEIQKAGYLMDPWGGKWDPVGISMMTPVSDGEFIYVSTGFGAVFCVDLDGTVRWKQWFGGGMDRAPAIPSPILVGDLLIISGHDPEGKANRASVRMALDKKTGKPVWKAPFGGSYQACPVALRLHVGGDAAKPMDVLYYIGDGTVLRARDGKKLAENLPGNWSGRPAAVSGDIVVLKNKEADGGAYRMDNPVERDGCAIRLRAPSNDTVAFDTLWQGKDLSWSGYLARGNILYHLGDGKIETFHLESGKQIAEKGNPGKGSRQYAVLAGDALIGFDDHGFSTVARVSADGQIGTVTANRLGTLDYGKAQPNLLDKCFNYGAQFTVSGNRLWTRSNTHLYCIGNLQEKLRLSPLHEKGAKLNADSVK